MTNNKDVQFELLPLQVIETEGGILLRRGSEQFAIQGRQAFDFVQYLEDLSSAGAFSYQSVMSSFAAPDREKVLFLIRELGKRGMVRAAEQSGGAAREETREDVFYWNLGTSTREVRRKLEETPVAIVGVSKTAHELARSLSSAGASHLEVIDDPALRTQSVVEENDSERRWPNEVAVYDKKAWMENNSSNTGLLVVCSDFGGRQMLLPWNAFCLENGIPFLPVVLKDHMGFVGPLVIPGETPCYYCAVSRQAMHESAAEKAIDAISITNQDAQGAHPFMFNIIANMATGMILSYTGMFPTFFPDRIIAFDMIRLTSTEHRVLKVPRCPSCSKYAIHARIDQYPISPLPRH